MQSELIQWSEIRVSSIHCLKLCTSAIIIATPIVLIQFLIDTAVSSVANKIEWVDCTLVPYTGPYHIILLNLKTLRNCCSPAGEATHISFSQNYVGDTSRNW